MSLFFVRRDDLERSCIGDFADLETDCRTRNYRPPDEAVADQTGLAAVAEDARAAPHAVGATDNLVGLDAGRDPIREYVPRFAAGEAVEPLDGCACEGRSR